MKHGDMTGAEMELRRTPTSEQRIAEWAKALQIQLWNNEDWGQDIDMLESAARTLTASVRAEAIEEAAKVCDAAAKEKEGKCDNGVFWCHEPLYMASQCASAIRNLLDRALVKERKAP